MGSTLRSASSPRAEMARLMERKLVMAVSCPLGSAPIVSFSSLSAAHVAMAQRQERTRMYLASIPRSRHPSLYNVGIAQ